MNRKEFLLAIPAAAAAAFVLGRGRAHAGPVEEGLEGLVPHSWGPGGDLDPLRFEAEAAADALHTALTAEYGQLARPTRYARERGGLHWFEAPYLFSEHTSPLWQSIQYPWKPRNESVKALVCQVRRLGVAEFYDTSLLGPVRPLAWATKGAAHVDVELRAGAAGGYRVSPKLMWRS